MMVRHVIHQRHKYVEYYPLDQEKEKEGPATMRGFQLEAASSELLLRTLGYQGDR